MNPVPREQLASLSAPPASSIGNTVIPIFLLAILLPVRGFDSVVSGLPDLPINTLAAILLIMIAAFVRPRWRVDMPAVVVTAGALLMSLLVPSALIQPDFELRRAGSLTILFGLAYVIAGGRLQLDSLRRGMLVGLVAAVAIGTALIGRSSYAGRLSGLLGDPNGFGFTLVAIGFGIAQGMARRRDLILLWVFLAGSIWLTQSRTTMFAFAVATLWVFFGRRLGRITGLIVLVGITWLFQWTSEFAERQGWFVERLGSDNLRDRLEETERLLTATAGWWGHGLGTAVAEFDGITLFFHNSYRALQTEGGLVALILLIILGMSLFWLFPSLPATSRPVWAEGAIIAGCICSVNIGYSLTQPAMATAIGMYIAYHCLAREQLKAESATSGSGATPAAPTA